MIDPANAIDFARSSFSSSPEIVVEAPGRINYIGEHTDYNGGLALPVAIDRGISMVITKSSQGSKIRAISQSQSTLVEVGLDDVVRMDSFEGWSRYLLGAVKVLLDEGFALRGADIAISSDLPLGSGLSSSAALLLAVIFGLSLHNGLDLPRDRVVELAHRAESSYSGANVGYLDHFAIGFANPNRATLIDFATMKYHSCEMPFSDLIVVDSNVHHSISAGGYGKRRLECELAAKTLNHRFISEATLEEAQSLEDLDLRRRAMHVISENERVRSVARAFDDGKTGASYLVESHESLRDQFQVSCAETDLIVESVLRAGAEGARMVGGGFGGSCIVVGGDFETLESAVSTEFASRGFVPPTFFRAGLSGVLRQVV
ncbi:MAG: galactokinase [Actinomycetota bacterium]|nr:galactokinase [Actinomycetota bacterium]